MFYRKEYLECKAGSQAVHNENKLLKQQLDESEQKLTAAYAEQEKLKAELEGVHSLYEQFSSFGGSFEAFRSSMQVLTDNLKAEKESVNQTADVSVHSRDAVNEIARRVKEMANQTHDAASEVESLNQRAEDISGIVRLIQEISDQTNLLALNAAIEAARAGEMGRGFAVVADEVRNLAQRTGEATQEISSLVENIQTETTGVKQRMETVAVASEDLGQMGDKAVATIRQSLDIHKDMEASIASSALRSFAELAKLDHLLFKFNIYQQFMGLKDLETDDLPTSKECRLGKWYHHGEGQSCYSKLEGYSLIEHPHRMVHEKASDALAHFRNENMVKAFDALADMEAGSLEVQSGLDSLVKSGENNRDLLCME